MGEIGVGATTPFTGDYQVKYDYDGDSDRLTSVNPGPGLPGGWAAGTGVQYVYEVDGNGTAKSNLVTQLNYKSGSSTTIAQTTRTFGGRGLIDSVQNDWSGTSPYMVSKYAYSNDALARRAYVIRTGSNGAFDGTPPRPAASARRAPWPRPRQD